MEGRNTRTVSSLLAELELHEFIDQVADQGFRTVQDLLDLTEAEVMSSGEEIGMKRGHLVRLNRWLHAEREARTVSTPVVLSPAAEALLPESSSPPRATRATTTIHELRNLGVIPSPLRPSFLWDFDAHPFSHSPLIVEATDVLSILDGLGAYVLWWLTDVAPKKHKWFSSPESESAIGVHLGASSGVPGRSVGDLDNGRVVFSIENPATFNPESVFGERFEKDEFKFVPHLFLGPNARILGGTFDLSKGSIFIGSGVTVEPGAYIKGPCIIGEECEIRTGAYLRGDVLLGDKVCVRCEIKHSVVMNNSELCHPGYVGDSILGFGSHFGCQSLTANLPLMGDSIIFTCTDDRGGSLDVDLQRRKLGSIMGDACQLGCNSVAEPGVVMGPRTFVYPLTRLPKGCYGPNELVKNKPLEHGVVERCPLR